MKLTISPYLAGLATAAIAIFAGFGGGMLIANQVDSGGAVPAPGMSRIERTKREEPILASAGDNAVQSRQAVADGINPLAEATPIASVDAGPGLDVSLAPSGAYPQSEATISEPVSPAQTLPVAIEAIQRTPHHGQRITAGGRQLRDSKRARTAQRDEAAMSQPVVSRRRVKAKDSGREIARYREGSTRYVVRTRNGLPADPKEVQELKRELRARREFAETDGRALSYGSERSGVFSRIFPD